MKLLGVTAFLLPFSLFLPVGSQTLWSGWLLMAVFVIWRLSARMRVSVALADALPWLFCFSLGLAAMAGDEPVLGIKKALICTISLVFVRCVFLSGEAYSRQFLRGLLLAVNVHAALIVVEFGLVNFLDQSWIPTFKYSSVGPYLFGNIIGSGGLTVDDVVRGGLWHSTTLGSQVVPAGWVQGTNGLPILGDIMYRPSGFFFHHGLSGMLLCFGLAAHLAEAASGRWKQFTTQSMILILIAVFASLSRTTYFLASLLVVVFLLQRHRADIVRSWPLVLKAGRVVLIAATAMIAVPALWQTVVVPLLSAVGLLDVPGAAAGEGQARFRFIVDALDYMQARGDLVLGVGPGHAPWAHLSAVQITVDGGLLTLVLALLCYLTVLLRTFSIRNTGFDYRAEAMIWCVYFTYLFFVPVAVYQYVLSILLWYVYSHLGALAREGARDVSPATDSVQQAA